MATVYRVMQQHPTRPEISVFDTTNRREADEYRVGGWAVLELSAEVAALFPSHPKPTRDLPTATSEVGGPAFPFVARDVVAPGMSLRDHVAAQALASLISHQGKDGVNCGKQAVPTLARFAFEYADEFLRARQAPAPSPVAPSAQPLYRAEGEDHHGR